MSDTPKTDAARVDESDFGISLCDWVRADFARELERELSAAQKRIEELETVIAGFKELKITQTLNSYETNQVYPGLIIRK